MAAPVDSGGPNKLLVCHEELTNRDLWPRIQEALNVRLPLTSLTFENKFKKLVQVDELDVEFLPMKHQRIQRLRQHQHNPTSWFRLPYCHIIIVTAMEPADYKASIRSKLNAMLNGPKGTLEALCEILIVYVRPPEADPAAKGPKKVFDRIRDDFNPKRGIDRCVRLDLYDAAQLKDAQGMIIGLDNLELSIKDCIKTAFYIRQTAYDEEARKLMSHRMEMRASFGTLFLVKDSLALMLESVRLLEDALREYFELEAACLEALEEGGSLNGQPFGGDEKGDDVATLMTATWKSVHQSVHANKPLKEFKLRQYLFSAKARLLFHLNRPTEVVDRGLKFIQDFTKLISNREADTNFLLSFREVSPRVQSGQLPDSRSTAAKFYSSRDHEMMNKSGNWFGGQDTAEKPRIQLSEVDWDVGVCGLEDVTADLDFNSLGGQSKRAAHRFRERDVRHWHFYSSLGHLYASAREELRRIFDAIYGELETGSTADGLKGFHADMLPSFTPVCLSASRTTSIDCTSRRQSLSVQKTSTLIEALQRRASRRRMSMQAMSMGSEDQFLLDGEGMPSWMTRAGLGNTPRHQRRNTGLQIPSPLPDSPQSSAGSFVSVASGMETGALTDIDNLDASSVISYDTTTTPMTASQAGDGVQLLLRSVGGSSHYAGSVAPPPSESVMSSLDQPVSRATSRKDAQASISHKDTQSPRSLASHAVGGSGFNPDTTNSDSLTAGISPPVVPDKLNWVVDWRIRRALASEELYEDLFVELTLAAAWCYARCGRLRTSALLRVDVAPLLLNHGLVSAAQQLYHMKADMYLREGWNVLSGHVLPQLTACLRGDDPTRLMSACLMYLSLQEKCTDEEEVKKMMIDFTTCAKEIAESDSAAVSTLITHPALQIAPVQHRFSELYERKDNPTISAVLSPKAIRRPVDFSREGRIEPHGALLLYAGDVAHIEAEIHSTLPEEIVLTNVEVCITIVGDDSVSGIRSMTSMVDSTFAPAISATSPVVRDVQGSRVYRTHSIQDLPTERIQKSSLQLFCSIDEESTSDHDELHVSPGTTPIRFKCCPVREGFYGLYFLTGDYHGTSLCLPLLTSPEKIGPCWIQHPAKKKQSVGESLDFLRNRLREAVVLHVEPAVQRIDVSTAVPQGCFVTGQAQWIGIVIKGARSAEMQKATLSLSLAGHIDCVRLPTAANITDKAVDDAEGIDDWVIVANGEITLPPGFLYKGSLVTWMLMDLTSLSSLPCRLSDVRRHDQSISDFDRRPDVATTQEGTVHLQTQLEYFNGCWRSHASLMSIPVTSPFASESNFIKINAISMLVTIRLASQLPVVSEIESVQLELFCPRKQNCRPALIGPSFPTPLHPSEVMNIAFRLAKNEAKILAASARESEEQVVNGEFSMVYRTDLYSKHKPLQSSGKSEVLVGLRFPPTPQEDGSATEQTCTFRRSVELDVLLGGEGPKHDLFRISLLPPPSIVCGVPVALTWMFERIGTVHSKESIAYEIVPETGWKSCVPLNGAIFVPVVAAATATLETTFIAISEGELQAPRLFLTQNKIQSPLVFLKVTSDEN